MTTGGLSRERLGRMHDVLTGHVEHGGIPGLVSLISRRGEVHVDAIGQLAIGGAPVQRDSLFRIASMSKPVTAAAAMILVEECRLRLDDPVDRLLPELANRRVLKRLESELDDTVPANRPITVRDVLTFRLGLGAVMLPRDATPIQRAMSEQRLRQGPPKPLSEHAPDDWMRRVGTLPLIHQPGERWLYDLGSDLLSVLIARASGQSLDVFLRERLFEPLGMKDTAFSVPAEKIHRLATCYSRDRATGALRVYDEPASGDWSRPPAFPSGAGGLVSTVDDYLAFAQMLLNLGVHGRKRILSRPAVELMTMDHLTPAQKAVSGLTPGYFDSHGWGFGVSVVTRRDNLAPSVGSYGWNGGLGTSWDSDPEEELVGILLTQRAWDSPIPPPVFPDFLTSAYQTIDD